MAFTLAPGSFTHVTAISMAGRDDARSTQAYASDLTMNLDTPMTLGQAREHVRDLMKSHTSSPATTSAG